MSCVTLVLCLVVLKPTCPHVTGSLAKKHAGLHYINTSLGVTAEALWANIGSKSAISLQRGPVDPKFQVEGVAWHSSQKTRLNDLSYGIKIWTDLSSVLSQSTRLTYSETEFSSLDCICISCSAAKNKLIKYQNNIETVFISLADHKYRLAT